MKKESNGRNLIIKVRMIKESKGKNLEENKSAKLLSESMVVFSMQGWVGFKMATCT